MFRWKKWGTRWWTENMVRDDGDDDTESESGDKFELDDSEWIMC